VANVFVFTYSNIDWLVGYLSFKWRNGDGMFMGNS
jgi:hypothetical protein